MTGKGCDNCYYSYFDEKAYPCSLCIRGIERIDQWQPSKKTKADRKTESDSEKPNNCEPQTDMAEDIVRSFGFKTESYRQAKAKDEPIDRDDLGNCNICKYVGLEHRCNQCVNGSMFCKVEDEPQLTPNYCGTCKHREVPCGELPCDVCHDYSNYEPKTEPITHDDYVEWGNDHIKRNACTLELFDNDGVYIEPQTKCYLRTSCDHYGDKQVCGRCHEYNLYSHTKTEPQTEREGE